MSHKLYKTTVVVCDGCEEEFDLGPGIGIRTVRAAAVRDEGWSTELVGSRRRDLCRLCQPSDKDRSTTTQET